MNRRTNILDTTEAAIKGADTLAGERVYIQRTRPIDMRSDDKPPLVSLYLPELVWKPVAGVSSRWDETGMLEIECWATVDPERASRVKGDPDRLQSMAVDALVQQVANALLKSQEFLALFSERPGFKIEFAQDIQSQSRVGTARARVTWLEKNSSLIDEDVTYDDLKTLWTDHEIKDSPGMTPDEPAISLHPDLQVVADDLDEE